MCRPENYFDSAYSDRSATPLPRAKRPPRMLRRRRRKPGQRPRRPGPIQIRVPRRPIGPRTRLHRLRRQTARLISGPRRDGETKSGWRRAALPVLIVLLLIALCIGGASLWSDYRDATVLQQAMTTPPAASRSARRHRAAASTGEAAAANDDCGRTRARSTASDTAIDRAATPDRRRHCNRTAGRRTSDDPTAGRRADTTAGHNARTAKNRHRPTPRRGSATAPSARPGRSKAGPASGQTRATRTVQSACPVRAAHPLRALPLHDAGVQTPEVLQPRRVQVFAGDGRGQTARLTGLAVVTGEAWSSRQPTDPAEPLRMINCVRRLLGHSSAERCAAPSQRSGACGRLEFAHRIADDGPVRTHRKVGETVLREVVELGQFATKERDIDAIAKHFPLKVSPCECAPMQGAGISDGRLTVTLNTAVSWGGLHVTDGSRADRRSRDRPRTAPKHCRVGLSPPAAA